MYVVARVAGALLVLHEAGLAHGDVKPEKILLKRDGTAKHFGFSGTGPTGSAAIRDDLRALGMLARHCMTGCTSPADLDPC